MPIIKHDFWGDKFQRTHSLNDKLQFTLADFGISHEKSKIYAFDFEVFPTMWLVNFTNVLDRSDTFFVLNDYKALCEIMKDNRTDVFVGYNIKGYDNWIAKAIMLSATNEQVYELSKLIVNSTKTNPFNPWEWGFFKYKKQPQFVTYDVMLDIIGVISLKKYEFKLGMDIEECDIPWDYKGKWTNEMVCDVAKYCQYDVLSTIEVLHKHKEEVLSKSMIHKLFPYVSLADCFKKTGTQLATMVVKAKKRPLEHNLIDIPNDIKLRDTELVQKYATNKQIPLFEKLMFGTTCKFGSGGVHGAIKNSVFHSEGEYLIMNSDVGSFYPNIIRLKNQMSRCVPPEMQQAYSEMIAYRLELKAKGDKVGANTYKLVLNKLYGSFGSEYQETYDRQALFGVCALGQLYLADLMEKLHDCTGGDIQFINVNTDGVMYRFKVAKLQAIMASLDEWQQRTGFGLEHEVIKSMYQRDVNNYVEVRLSKKNEKFETIEDEVQFTLSHKVSDDGVEVGIKAKGVDVNNYNGYNEINTNCIAIQKAIVNYLVFGRHCDATFSMCDMKDFALCISAGSSYECVMSEYKGNLVKVNKVNRCYAVHDREYGQIFKMKRAEDGTLAKQHLKANLPHCRVDNKGVLDDKTILDMNWYKEVFNEKVVEFLRPTTKRKIKK